METLMIIIALTFTPVPGQPGVVSIGYQAKIGVTPNLEACQKVEKAFAEERGSNVIVICKEKSSKKAT